MRKLTLLILVPVLAAACGGSRHYTSPTKTTASSGADSKVLVGAGSTFVYPLVSQWIADHSEKTGVTVSYGAMGSGGGIAAVSDRSVDFGASDAPLTSDQQASCKNCVQVAWALAGTSVAYHLEGAPRHLRLSGPVLANIFLGKITSWNDPAIAKLNSGASLPATHITPVFRSDSSGTSFNFSDYLSHVSPTWKSEVGRSTQPTFPTGQGARGSSGVSGLVSNTDGALTYVDVAYAATSHLSYAAVENKAGKFTLPDVKTCSAAASVAGAPEPNKGVSIVDPSASAAAAYPICTFTYVIVPHSSPNAGALKQFLDYALTNGQQLGAKLLFSPLPKAVVAASKKAVATIH